MLPLSLGSGCSFWLKGGVALQSRMIKDSSKGRARCWVVPGNGYQVLILWSQELRVVQVKAPCIGFIQENLIESSLQSSLPYIPIYMVHASYYASYPKVPCVRHEVNMWCTCCIISLLLEPSIFFYISCDRVMSSLTLTLSSKNRKMKINPMIMRIRK